MQATHAPPQPPRQNRLISRDASGKVDAQMQGLEAGLEEAGENRAELRGGDTSWATCGVGRCGSTLAGLASARSSTVDV